MTMYILQCGGCRSKELTEKEALMVKENAQPYFSKPIEMVPVEVETKSMLLVIEGGRKE